MNLAAIENSDHMTSPRADKYDFDGWYRATITELIAHARDLEASRTLNFKLIAEEQIRLPRQRITELEDVLRPFANVVWSSTNAESDRPEWKTFIPQEQWENAARVLGSGSPESTEPAAGSESQ